MNDRIRELKENTLASLRDRPFSMEEFHEKFAELIVKECVWQVVKDNAVPHNIQVLIGERFEKHFGVEE